MDKQHCIVEMESCKLSPGYISYLTGIIESFDHLYAESVVQLQVHEEQS